MKMKINRVLVVGCGFAIASSALAQVTKSGPGYLFRVKWAKGTINYSLDSTVGGMPSTKGSGSMKIAAPVVLTVASVRNGVADLSVRTGPISMNGNVVMQATTQKIQADQYGKPIGGGGKSSQVLPAGLPTGPVKVGQTWSASVPLAGPMAGKKVTAKYTFVGLQDVGGRQCAKLNMILTGASTGSGTYYLTVADGLMFQMNMNLNQVIPGGTKPLKISVVINRR